MRRLYGLCGLALAALVLVFGGALPLLADDDDNLPPVLDPIGNKTASVGQPLTFTATATDPDLDDLFFSLENGTAGVVPAGAVINTLTGVFTWTPTAEQVGLHTFDVVVTDDGLPPLRDFETITVTVEADDPPPVNQPPVLDPVGNKTATVGQLLTFTATASDPDADTVFFSLAAGVAGAVPTGAVIDSVTGVFTWTPTAVQVGLHTFDVVVTDNGTPPLSDSETITVTVEADDPPPVNQPPVLTAIGNKTATVGQMLTFTATASDPDDDTLTFGLSGAVPTGAGIDPLSGVFAWTPGVTQLGAFTFDVVVTDNGDPALSDSETITVTVNDPPPVNNLLQNPGFETQGARVRDAANWNGSNLRSNDRRVCNVARTDRPDTIFARTGNCAFRFRLARPLARFVQQRVTLTGTSAGQTLYAEAYIETDRLTNGAALLVTVTYDNNTTDQVRIRVPRGTQPYRKISGTLTLRREATSVRVRITTGGARGFLLVDDVLLGIREAGGLLPLDADPALRGN